MKYGAAIGFVSGIVLTIPTFIKTRSKLVLLAGGLTSAAFFGMLVTVSTVMGQLEGLEGKEPRKYEVATGEAGAECLEYRPVWAAVNYK
jgi:hypothetical protein